MPPTFIRGRSGSLSGIIAGGSSTFNARIDGWQIGIERQVHETSAFGDGGIETYDEGLSRWSFSCSGFMLGNGSADRVGITSLQGTNTATGTAAFVADGGRIYTGTVLVTRASPQTNYRGGNAKVVFQGVGNSILSES